MNKDEFDAMLATLQAQLDAADRVLAEANAVLDAAWRGQKDAKDALRGHLSYGKHRGWVERAKRAKKGEDHADEAFLAAE